MLASAASAQQAYLTSDGPVTLTGTETGSATNRLTGFKTFFECPGTTYTGHTYNKTPHVPLDKHSTTATITPHYGADDPTGKGCVVSALKFPVTVDMNECDYVFHLGETTPAPAVDEYEMATTIDCPTGKHIVFTFTVSGKPCTITITEKEGANDTYNGLDAKDTTNGTIDIAGEITGIEAHAVGTACIETGTQNMALKQDVTVKGLNELGEETKIGISELGDETGCV